MEKEGIVVRVEMPRASWEMVLSALDMLIEQGYLMKAEYKEIAEQVYSQEY